jgi:hypothetical protein
METGQLKSTAMNPSTEICIAADHYALSFSNLSHEHKLRLREAVLYGASLNVPAAKTLEASEVLTDAHYMPFGIYANKKRMSEVPAVYYKWLYDNHCNHAGVKKYILDRFESIMEEANKVKR